MSIQSIYGGSAGVYTDLLNRRKQDVSQAEKPAAAQESIPADSAARTAADELSYLSGKYKNYSFVAANYSQGMQYGSSSTVNVAISPQFLAKMANDPELEKEYEGYIADMQRLDEQFSRSVEAGGWHVVAKGWAIDKDGGISSWCITQKDDTKSYLQKLSEKAEELMEKANEKKARQAETEEKRQAEQEEKLQEELRAACRDKLGQQFKDLIIAEQEDETAKGTALDIRA